MIDEREDREILFPAFPATHPLTAIRFDEADQASSTSFCTRPAASTSRSSASRVPTSECSDGEWKVLTYPDHPDDPS